MDEVLPSSAHHASNPQGGLRASQDGGFGGMGGGDDQMRFLQESCGNVKRSGYHMQQAIVNYFIPLPSALCTSFQQHECNDGNKV